jgi:hypothetical protein
MEVIRTVELGGHTYNDVICNITFRLRVLNPYKRGVTLDNSVEIVLDPATTPESFLEFSALTQEAAMAWFESAVDQSVRDQMVARALAQVQNPDYIYHTQVPWYIVDPAHQ